jgi:hypothetical protein
MDTALRPWLCPDPRPPEAANQDWLVMRPGQPPALALREARLTQDWLRRRLAWNPGLRRDPEWQFLWQHAQALERWVTWRLEQGWPWP